MDEIGGASSRKQTVQAELHSESSDHLTLPEGTLESK